MPWAERRRPTCGCRCKLARADEAEAPRRRWQEALARVGLADFRRRLSARTVRRHEDARVDCARAGDRAARCC